MEKDWSQLAEDFDDLQRLVTGERADQAIKRELSRLQDLGDLVELGCGSGNYTKVLAPKARSILATDVSEDMVRVASKRLADFESIRVDWADAYATKLVAGSFDTVFMANLIHVVSQPDRVMQEAARLLKDKGRLIILSFTADGLSDEDKLGLAQRFVQYFGQPPKGGTPFSAKTLTAFVAGHGFQVEDVKCLDGQISKAILLQARKTENKD